MKPSGAGLEERTSAVAEHVAFEDFPNSGADLLRNMHAENAFVSGSNGTGYVPADKPFRSVAMGIGDGFVPFKRSAHAFETAESGAQLKNQH